MCLTGRAVVVCLSAKNSRTNLRTQMCLKGAFSFFRRLIRKISSEHKKKHEKSGATGLRSRWRCEKCAKSRVSRFRSKVPSAHGARDIFRKIFGAAPVGWPGGRGQTTQRLTETRTMHGASSFLFSVGPLDRRHGPEDAPAQRTDVPRERSRERRAASASTNKSVKNRETRRRQVKISRVTSTLLSCYY